MNENKVEYAALKYYNNIISDECLYIGILFHNLTNGKRDFRHITNFKRLQSFDDEVDIDFIKAYLHGIKEQVEENLFNRNKFFSIKEFSRIYVNEMKFTKANIIQVNDNEDYVEKITKMYLKFDFNKETRLTKAEEKKYIKKILISSFKKLSSNKIEGQYKENVTFDYVINNIAIKFFSFKGKDVSKLISSAKYWGFTAEELKDRYNIVFLYDSDNIEKSSFEENIVKNILAQYAKVFSLNEGLDYILSAKPNENPSIEASPNSL